VLLCAGALSGCIESHLARGIMLVNESSETFYLQDATLKPGGDIKYHVVECTDNPLSLVTTAGVEYASLDEEYCPGQTWTITDRGEVVLTDD